jgi:threonylcarbamoyladenosine tRNA methylthiotransferase MtaB
VTDVEVVTFGCRLNLVESEAMRRAATAAGRRNVAIVNTCAVTAEAVRQGRQAIRRLKRADPERAILVTGCAAEIDPAAYAAMPEVAEVFGNAGKTAATAFSGHNGGASPVPAVLSEGVEDHTRAFLAVQTGCDHRCSFCIIPFGRGASRSAPLPDVAAAAARLAARGFREVVLTGVDLTAYGADLPERPSLGGLVRAILEAAPGLDRLRLSSIDCIEADPALLETIAAEPRLMPHLHLSLQSGDDLVLKRMKRRHSRADAVAFCADLRRARPDIVFGADLIAGFPTETEAMFANTLALVEDCGLTHLHVFPFSARPGTPAARMPPVAPATVKARAAALRLAGAAALRAHLERQVGRRVTVLAERGGIGRMPDFTPVRVEGLTPGALAEVAITAAGERTLTGVRAI